MEISRSVLISLYVFIGLYLIFKVIFKKNPYQEDYERLYNKILHSDKYKVKGQYDKEE